MSPLTSCGWMAPLTRPTASTITRPARPSARPTDTATSALAVTTWPRRGDCSRDAVTVLCRTPTSPSAHRATGPPGRRGQGHRAPPARRAPCPVGVPVSARLVHRLQGLDRSAPSVTATRIRATGWSSASASRFEAGSASSASPQQTSVRTARRTPTADSTSPQPSSVTPATHSGSTPAKSAPPSAPSGRSASTAGRHPARSWAAGSRSRDPHGRDQQGDRLGADDGTDRGAQPCPPRRGHQSSGDQLNLAGINEEPDVA